MKYGLSKRCTAGSRKITAVGGLWAWGPVTGDTTDRTTW